MDKKWFYYFREKFRLGLRDVECDVGLSRTTISSYERGLIELKQEDENKLINFAKEFMVKEYLKLEWLKKELEV